MYLCHKLRRPAVSQARRRLRSASSMSLDVRRTRLSTVGDRAFAVAAAHLWNSLLSHVTAPPSLSIGLDWVELKGELNPKIKLDLNDSFFTLINKYNSHNILILRGLKEIPTF